MRKIFTLTLIALLLGVGVVATIETEPGYLLLAYGDYTLESSLWVGLVLIVLATVLLYGLIALLRRVMGGKKSLTGWLGSRRARQAARLTDRGLISFIEGNWAKARRDLLRGARSNDAPLANYLLAARASARLEDSEQTEQQLVLASESSAAAKTAVALTRAEIRLRAGKYQEAINTLQEVRRSPGRYPQALTLLQQAYSGLGDEAGLVELLPLLKKYQACSADELQRLETDIYLKQLQRAGDVATGANLDSLCDTWHRMPVALREDAAMIRRYAELLVVMGGHAQAEKIILKALKHNWDSQLARVYAYVQSDNTRRQLAQAESWLTNHAADAELLLCLGRLAARDKLWGKSRDYFEKSYRLHRSPEICAELGRLLSGMGEANVAAAYFREGLLLQEDRLPRLPKPDKIVADPRLLTRG